MVKFLHWLLRLLYGFRGHNLAVLNTPGPVLLLPNHVSWWDWLLIGVCLEKDWRFVTSITSAEISWVHRRIMINRRTFPVDVNSPFAVKHMAEYLQKGGRLVLFPEGRLSRTGSIMKLFDGTGFLILKTHAKVITAYIRGAKRLPFSPNPGLKQWFPHISVHFSPVLTPPHRVGVLLPNVNAMPATLLGLWAAKKIPAVLNYSTGPAVLLECARLARVKQIITSRAFIERLALDLEPFRAAGMEPLFLED